MHELANFISFKISSTVCVDRASIEVKHVSKWYPYSLSWRPASLDWSLPRSLNGTSIQPVKTPALLVVDCPCLTNTTLLLGSVIIKFIVLYFWISDKLYWKIYYKKYLLTQESFIVIKLINQISDSVELLIMSMPRLKKIYDPSLFCDFVRWFLCHFPCQEVSLSFLDWIHYLVNQ